MKISVNPDQPQSDQYFDIVLVLHNSTYHVSLKCSPTEVLHGRFPYKDAVVKFSNSIGTTNPSKDISKMLDKEKADQKNEGKAQNTMASYDKYKLYSERKTQTLLSKVFDHVF